MIIIFFFYRVKYKIKIFEYQMKKRHSSFSFFTLIVFSAMLVLSFTQSCQSFHQSIRLLQNGISSSNLLSSDPKCSEKPRKMLNQKLEHTQWRSEILQGINLIQKLEIPLQTIVFGEKAASILIGQEPTDILIAAAEIGKGRVLTISSHLYYGPLKNSSDPQLAQLENNINKWVTKNQSSSISSFLSATEYLKSQKKTNCLALYVLQLENSNSQDQKQAISDFVINGGGLITIAVDYLWGEATGKTFTGMLSSSLLLQAGIAFSPHPIKTSRFNPHKSGQEKSHLKIQITRAFAQKRDDQNYLISKIVLDQVKYLPNSAKSKLKHLMLRLMANYQIYEMAPSLSNPISSFYLQNKLLLYHNLAIDDERNLGFAASNYESFPGKVESSPQTKLNVPSVELSFTGLSYQELHFTQYYAIAGETIQIEIIGPISDPKWYVLLGVHTDDNTMMDCWVRWPKIYTLKELNQQSLAIRSPFGGLIVLKSPEDNKQIQIKLKNAVKAPFYRLNDINSMKDWQQNRIAPGAWGCALGKYVGICLPRSSLLKVQDPSETLRLFDDIYRAYHELRGTGPDSQRRQIIISDIAPSTQKMFDDYLIVANNSIADPNNEEFIFNLSSIRKKGRWGIFSEMGRNMQKYERMLSFDSSTLELSNYILTLKGMQISTGASSKDISQIKTQKQRAKDYLKSPSYEKLKNNPEVYVLLFVQLIEDFGWDEMKNTLSSSQGGIQDLDNDQQYLEYFWNKYSIEVNENLSPLLRRWGIPISNQFQQKLTHLKNYTEKVNIFV